MTIKVEWTIFMGSFKWLWKCVTQIVENHILIKKQNFKSKNISKQYGRCVTKRQIIFSQPLFLKLDATNQFPSGKSIYKVRLALYVQILLEDVGCQIIIHGVQRGTLFEDLMERFVHIGSCDKFISEIAYH